MNQNPKIFSYMQISKDAVVSLHHLFSTLSTAKTTNHPYHCAEKLQRVAIHLKTGLLVKFTRCTFQFSGFNIMYNTAEHNSLVPICNEMKYNWLLGYKVTRANTGFQSSA